MRWTKERIFLFLLWKGLTLTGSVTLAYAAWLAPALEGKIIIAILAAIVFIGGMITELGEP